MREQEVRELYEAYRQVHQPQEEVEQLDENIQDAAKGALEAGAKFMKTNPVGKAIGAVLSPVGSGRKTPTKESGGYRPVTNEEVDLFDTILEYLVSEGYADTEEAALAIMANMSGEWRESIVEQSARIDYVQDKFNRENAAKSGSALTAIPGKQNTGQALQRARESARQMGKLQGV
jgi:hypothetical protein